MARITIADLNKVIQRLERELETLRVERQKDHATIESQKSTIEDLANRLSAASDMHTAACVELAKAISPAKDPASAAEDTSESEVALDTAPVERPAHIPDGITGLTRATYWKYVELRRAKCRAAGIKTVGYDSFETWVSKWTAILVPVAAEAAAE